MLCVAASQAQEYCAGVKPYRQSQLAVAEQVSVLTLVCITVHGKNIMVHCCNNFELLVKGVDELYSLRHTVYIQLPSSNLYSYTYNYMPYTVRI